MADVPNEPVVYLNRDFVPLGEAIEEVRAQPSLQGTPDDAPETWRPRSTSRACRVWLTPCLHGLSHDRLSPAIATFMATYFFAASSAATRSAGSLLQVLSELRRVVGDKLRAIAHPADRDEEGALRRQVPLQ